MRQNEVTALLLRDPSWAPWRRVRLTRVIQDGRKGVKEGVRASWTGSGSEYVMVPLPLMSE